MPSARGCAFRVPGSLRFSIGQAAQRWFRAAVVLYPQIIERFNVSSYDLVLSDSHAIAKGVRTHDKQTHMFLPYPARFAWDMADIYRDAGPLRYPLVRNVASYALQRFRSWDFARAQRVDHYIANSAHVAALIQRCYGRAAIVIHPPVDTQRFATAVRRRPGAATTSRSDASSRTSASTFCSKRSRAYPDERCG